MALNSKTNNYAQEIQRKMKNNLSGGLQFSNKDQVIDYAVEELFTQLKSRKLI